LEKVSKNFKNFTEKKNTFSKKVLLELFQKLAGFLKGRSPLSCFLEKLICLYFKEKTLRFLSMYRQRDRD